MAICCTCIDKFSEIDCNFKFLCHQGYQVCKSIKIVV